MTNERLEKGYTDFVMGMIEGAARSSATNPAHAKVFDWNKAARIIAEKQPKIAAAGLAEDWNNTAGDIYRDGSTVHEGDTYTYLFSRWATPALELDDGDLIACYLLPDENEHDWDAHTYWPPTALHILQKTE